MIYVHICYHQNEERTITNVVLSKYNNGLRIQGKEKPEADKGFVSFCEAPSTRGVLWQLHVRFSCSLVRSTYM